MSYCTVINCTRLKISDSEIIDSILKGREDHVLSQLYTSCYPRVRRFILSRKGSEADAEDLFQDAVVTFFSKVVNRSFDAEKYQIEPFIIGVSKNLWIDKFRRDKKIDFTDETNEYGSTGDEHYVINQERAQIVNEILASVGDSCKEILIRVIYHGMSMKEISEELGYQSVDSAKTQHYKCRQKLIKKFKDNEYLKSILKGE